MHLSPLPLLTRETFLFLMPTNTPISPHRNPLSTKTLMLKKQTNENKYKKRPDQGTLLTSALTQTPECYPSCAGLLRKALLAVCTSGVGHRSRCTSAGRSCPGIDPLPPLSPPSLYSPSLPPVRSVRPPPCPHHVTCPRQCQRLSGFRSR